MIPLIRNLKANLQEANISALVTEGGDSLLRLLPEISEVISFKRKEIKGRWGLIKFIHLLKYIRNKNFDTVIVIPQSDRPTIIAFASGAKIRIGYESDSWWRNRLLTHKLKYNHEKNSHLVEHNLQILTDLGLEIYDSEISINIADQYISSISKKFNIPPKRDGKSILIHPGARGYLRQWGSENFAKVINVFSDDHRIYLIGGPSEENIIKEIAKMLKRTPNIMSAQLNIIEYAALCSLSDIFIGNDSAPIHIAAATGMFVVGLYGPTLSKFCRPWTDRRLLFDISTLQCRQCEQDKCLNSKVKACINEIKPEDVIEGLRKILNSQKSLKF